MTKVIVTGGGGQLAKAIKATWINPDVTLLDKEQLDLRSIKSIEAALDFYRPDVVINAGAYTNVDLCESQSNLASGINGHAVGYLANGCRDLGALFVQISTDYVFEGISDKPYLEADSPNPRTVYGASKLEGEWMAELSPKHLIVRTSWLYDVWGKNFLKTMLRLGTEGKPIRVVNDQRGTPTSCRSLARQLEIMVDGNWRGLVHATCQGEATWYEFAKEIFFQKDLIVDLLPCKTSEYNCEARRPAYSVLANNYRKSLGPSVMPDWKLALTEVLAQMEN